MKSQMIWLQGYILTNHMSDDMFSDRQSHVRLSDFIIYIFDIAVCLELHKKLKDSRNIDSFAVSVYNTQHTTHNKWTKDVEEEQFDINMSCKYYFYHCSQLYGWIYIYIYSCYIFCSFIWQCDIYFRRKTANIACSRTVIR